MQPCYVYIYHPICDEILLRVQDASKDVLHLFVRLAYGETDNKIPCRALSNFKAGER